MEIRIGDTVFGKNKDERYEIIAPIGSGSFGIVYEAQDEKGNKYAIKTVNTTFLDDDSLRTLINEGNLAINIHHENVLPVFYFHDGVQYPELPPYMVLEYANGGTLEEWISEKRRLQEYFTLDKIYDLFLTLSKGMKTINEHLVHRDVKPDNILLVNGVLKITDFGLSKVVGVATRTSTLKGINHIKYCAPEAWRIEANTPAMDMYSMGIVFYEIATLAYPYQVSTQGDLIEAWKNAHLVAVPQNPKSINPSLDNNISQVIMKMIEKQPGQRYSSWDEIITRLSKPDNDDKKDLAAGVPELVQRAMHRRREEEMGRLKAEEEQRIRDEYEAIVGYCFANIVSAAQKYVDQFNQASDFSKLELRQSSQYFFDISQERKPARVIVTIVPLFEERAIDGNKIKAWGFAKAPSGKGFNLLLMVTQPDDLYGEWHTLHVSHSAFARNSNDRRQSPFPFLIEELPREIQLLRSVHIYKTSKQEFNPEFFVPLIEELI